ncbi:MAG: hypothetical protein ACI857_001144 [Arenicella sp.]|jgi:hypothetical protein
MRVLALLFLIGISGFAKADVWDNLTIEQAHKVQSFLKKHPYIIDYCDCCGGAEPTYLLKVTSTEIVECTLDKKQFSVLVKGKRITKFSVTDIGIDDYHTDFVDSEVEYTIYMNYTFGFDSHMKWAVPLHKLLDYPNDGPICFGATNYPDHKLDGVKITDADYIKWYAHHVAK